MANNHANCIDEAHVRVSFEENFLRDLIKSHACWDGPILFTWKSVEVDFFLRFFTSGFPGFFSRCTLVSALYPFASTGCNGAGAVDGCWESVDGSLLPKVGLSPKFMWDCFFEAQNDDSSSKRSRCRRFAGFALKP